MCACVCACVRACVCVCVCVCAADYCGLFQDAPEGLTCDECRQRMSEGQRRGPQSEGRPCERHQRSPEHEASYQRARASMGILYAHTHTCVWRVTRLLDEQSSRVRSGAPYCHRAWPFFETELSGLIKAAPNRLQLGTASAMEALREFEGHVPSSIEDLARKASYCHQHKAGVHRRLRDARPPRPLTSEAFADALHSKWLSRPSDKELLIDMHRKVVGAVANAKAAAQAEAHHRVRRDASTHASSHASTLPSTQNGISRGAPRPARDRSTSSTATSSNITRVPAIRRHGRSEQYQAWA